MKKNGLTLVELLIVLLIVGITSSFAIPSGKNILVEFKQYSFMHNLIRSISFARSEAITRNSTIRLCASNDGEFCSSSSRWEEGWIIYVDKAGKSVRTKDDPILKIHTGVKNITIRKNGREKTVKFNNSGWLGLNRSFYICDSQTLKPLKRLVIIHSGRVRITDEGIRCNA